MGDERIGALIERLEIVSGEVVCISAYTETLGEMGVPEDYGALIVSASIDNAPDRKLNSILFERVVIIQADAFDELLRALSQKESSNA